MHAASLLFPVPNKQQHMYKSKAACLHLCESPLVLAEWQKNFR